MKKIYLFIFILIGLSSYSFSQTLNAVRSAEIQDGRYTFTGNVILESFDDGSLQLRLDEDFGTQGGPDVRLFLSNSNSTNDAIEIVNLADVDHFSGAMTFDVPSDVAIDDFSVAFFYCVNFRQFWGFANLGPVMEIGDPTFMCLESSVATTAWAPNVNICPNDNNPDNIELRNTIGSSAADTNYAYLLTDENEMLQEVISSNFYDFENSGEETQRVYGVSYSGELNPVIGANRMQTTASNCIQHSTNDLYLTITKNACVDMTTCEESFTATTSWVAEVDICPFDGVKDSLELRNNLSILAGDNYAFIITDENEIVQNLPIYNDYYDFEGSGNMTMRVYGVSYSGELNAAMGMQRKDITSTGCIEHSGDDFFLTVTKNACLEETCEESLTASTAWETNFNICPSDNDADEIILLNNIMMLAGNNYAFLITDDNEILQEVVLEDSYDFNGTSSATQHIYGLSYSGELDIAIGEIRTQTTASGCAVHSDGDLFLKVEKTNCPTGLNESDLAQQVDLFPNPVTDQLHINLPTELKAKEVSIFTLQGDLVFNTGLNSTKSATLSLASLETGSYIIKIDGETNSVARSLFINR